MSNLVPVRVLPADGRAQAAAAAATAVAIHAAHAAGKRPASGAQGAAPFPAGNLSEFDLRLDGRSNERDVPEIAHGVIRQLRGSGMGGATRLSDGHDYGEKQAADALPPTRATRTGFDAL